MNLFRNITLIVISIICFLLSIKPAYAIDGFIRLTSPNGGETLTVGQTYTIRWESSGNIDKVNIGYKSCPSCLDWVVFTTANTGSYDWKVNVGNTTNTQFTLEITGYETGKGSLTDTSDGSFTVLGGSSSIPTTQPTSQSSSGTTTSSGSSPSGLNPNQLRRLTTPYITLMPTPTPTPKPLTIYSLYWSETFHFEGSTTTNLSDIKDPKHVTNFTLDTKYHWTLTFDETLDLTDPKKISMLKNIDSYWVVEWWFIWIKVEWWEVFNTPAEVKVTNDNLTGVPPKIIQTETTKQTNVTTATPTRLSEPTIKSSKPGEVVLAMHDGGKIMIEPNVHFVHKPTKPTRNTNLTLQAATSHKNLEYKVFMNGKETDIHPEVSKNGEFDVLVDGLVLGANYIELQYKDPTSNKFTKADGVTIIRSSFVETYWNHILYIGVGAIIVFALAVLFFMRKKLQYIAHTSMKRFKK